MYGPAFLPCEPREGIRDIVVWREGEDAERSRAYRGVGHHPQISTTIETYIQHHAFCRVLINHKTESCAQAGAIVPPALTLWARVLETWIGVGIFTVNAFPTQ